MMMILRVVSLTIILRVVCSHNATMDDSIHVVRIDNYGERVSLRCDYPHRDRAIFKHWVLPDLDVFPVNYTDPDGHIVLIPGNWSLVVEVVHAHHIGDYLCYGELEDGYALYSRSTVFLYVPPIWEEYYHNFVVGLSAAGATLVILTLLCIIHNFRYSDKSTGSAKKDSDATTEVGGVDGVARNGYDNMTYTKSGEDTTETRHVVEVHAVCGAYRQGDGGGRMGQVGQPQRPGGGRAVYGDKPEYYREVETPM